MTDFPEADFHDVAKHLKLRPSGRHWRGYCPVCERESFSFTHNRGKPLVYCFAGCEAKDLLAALRKLPVYTNQRPEREWRRKPARRRPEPDPLPVNDYSDWAGRAVDLWDQGVPLHYTLVETYLAARCCMFPTSGEIRFLPAHCHGIHPCMMARVTDAVTAEPISLHFTALNADGTAKANVDRPKLLLGRHRKKWGVIRLVEDTEVTTGLGLSEGIETGLSVMAGGWSPVWAALDAGNMADMPVLNGIESLTLFADNDVSGTGLKAAEHCAERWRAAGREVSIVMPKKPGTDWNDAA
jgi:putative DNA primase/helicase